MTYREVCGALIVQLLPSFTIRLDVREKAQHSRHVNSAHSPAFGTSRV
jgi:hypothetical protein